MAFSTARGNAVLNEVLNLICSLHSADPGNDGLNGELAGGSYSRAATTFGTSTAKTNDNVVSLTFNDLPAAQVTHIALWSGATCHNTSPLTVPFDVEAGESLQFNAGDLTQILT